MSKPKIVIQPDPMREELKQIKQRQLQRKEHDTPAKVTNEMLYEMLFDVLENQARIMNYLERGKFSG
ncbi:MAG TPA: hypothetical protein PK728_04530 [Bacillota bacterium]|nr:hypothetical protein [Bacillota bacterium]